MFEINKFMITLAENFDDMAEHNILGKRGEDIAVLWLQNNGYKIVDRNWRSGRNELDVVCVQDNVLVVVEIKSRCGTVEWPEELLPLNKRRSIVRLGARWLAQHCLDMEIRFDLVVVDMLALKVYHYPDAIMIYDV